MISKAKSLESKARKYIGYDKYDGTVAWDPQCCEEGDQKCFEHVGSTFF